MKYPLYIGVGALAVLAVGAVLFGGGSGGVGGVIIRGTPVNSSTTINTTATQAVAGINIGEYVRLQNDGAGVIYCYLDGNKTAPSSSIQANSGIRLYPASTTFGGPTLVEFGPDHINYRGNVNCIATAGSRLLIVR